MFNMIMKLKQLNLSLIVLQPCASGFVFPVVLSGTVVDVCPLGYSLVTGCSFRLGDLRRQIRDLTVPVLGALGVFLFV